jgi:ribosome-associated toxin RatA of RatAB toxin-antitoxin module
MKANNKFMEQYLDAAEYIVKYATDDGLFKRLEMEWSFASGAQWEQCMYSQCRTACFAMRAHLP